MLKAIVFDMDGVICDTGYLYFQMQSEFVVRQGGTQDREKLLRLVGKSYRALFQTMRELIGTEDSLRQIQARYDLYLGDAFERADYRPYFRRDTGKILHYAKENGLRLAVASSSALAHIRRVLGQCGIVEAFDFIQSGEGLRQSKPNPEIYLRVLESLGVRGCEAVAIEDSPDGIAAAKGAGLPVIAYVEERLPLDQSQADYFGRDMNEIDKIIRRLAAP